MNQIIAPGHVNEINIESEQFVQRMKFLNEIGCFAELLLFTLIFRN